MQTITLKLELQKPTQAKMSMYRKMTEVNTAFSNWLLHFDELKTATSKVFGLYSDERLPSAIVNQTIRTVKSKKKNQKAKTFRRLWCSFNNQNFKVERENGLFKVSFPTFEKRIGVPIISKDHQKRWLDKLLSGNVKQGTTELYEKRGRWFVAITLSFVVEQKQARQGEPKTMGIDIGLRQLAVATAGTTSIFFPGNEMAYRRRRFASRRRKLGEAKKLHTIRKSKNKESEWMKDANHKISRHIVDFALENGVHLIRMEDLTGIRHSKKSRKEAGRNLHSWSHYQLQLFIEYKAKMAGLSIEYVNPKHTSVTCKCGHIDKRSRKTDTFCCTQCGYLSHADVNASINIAKAVSGLSTRKTINN
ncbi:RNA-guided endonuclease TnpB family protein [Psychrobacillus soli]|uniref:IS200/IS605 family element transposase accessory protein TnpB n=1 Tax=Psychrobacillus soli TaxID=1543965 RepID=A0A544SXD8_9BACI|nr:RNA-guided endonuclease TnpB family protein [Psychrobacillus soli]TQR09856.1 IS200/IS605 family element transposase accessory protein TnpB [Psychrobacillus soli]